MDKNDLEELVQEYEAEECNFSEESCIKNLDIYLQRMEDSHFKAVLYKHLNYIKQN